MKLKLWELSLMPIFGGLMFISKLLMDALPNIHLIAMFITLFTVVFRYKALISIYTFVFLTGLYGGFGLWWFPYLYIWTVLWAVVMLLPLNMKKSTATAVYAVVCGLHGLGFGLLYAPFQAFVYGLSLEGTVTWLIAGIPYDAVHAVSNILTAMLIVPLSIPLKRAVAKINR